MHCFSSKSFVLECCDRLFYIYLIEKTFSGNVKTIDTMGFWEDDIGNLETRFGLLIFSVVSFRRTFQSIASHLVLSRVIKT